MKLKNQIKRERSIDSVISKLTSNEILNINQMICVRGGDGTIDPPIPPADPKK
jgi:hypothetical protein